MSAFSGVQSEEIAESLVLFDLAFQATITETRRKF